MKFELLYSIFWDFKRSSVSFGISIAILDYIRNFVLGHTLDTQLNYIYILDVYIYIYYIHIYILILGCNLV